MSHFEGSQLGMYLMYLREHDRESFDQIMGSVNRKKDQDKENDSLELSMKEGEEQVEDNPTIFVAVVSSRENFGSRVKAIIDTWADPQNMPEGATIRFFVGEPTTDSEFYGKPYEDIANLAAISGIKDLSKIVVLDNVVDDEYPPVRKNSAMIEKMDEIARGFETDPDAPTNFQWLYKTDDDAYVNFDGLLSFIRTRKYESFSVYGERGIGRAEDREGLKKVGLVKPYCTGGPGYIMSRQTVRETAPHLKACVQMADESEYRKYFWHSDSVIGWCIYNSTGAGCWDDDDYARNRIFRHNLHNEDPFIKTSDLSRTIATHPFKDNDAMMKQHARYIKLTSSLQ
jgi:hypothetical protein